MNTWPVQDAKAHFSELLNTCISEGPQIVTRLWAQLMHKQSNTVYEDAMIAATAIEHNLTVVTRNVRDFKRFEVNLMNPFE